MPDHQHYVPIIKAKAGELWTLSNATPVAREHMTPLLEVLKDPLLAPDLFEKVASGWGRDRVVFVDTVYLGTQTLEQAASLSRYMAAARVKQVKAVPVTSLGRSPAFQAVVRATLASDSRGVVIRLHPRDFLDPDTLARALTALMGVLDCEPHDADLIIDYEARADASELIQLCRLHLGNLPSTDQWRTLTVAAGSFPNSLLNFNLNEWYRQTHEEWIAWARVATGNPAPARKPAFGDYGVRDPRAPAEFGTPSANLRYTTDQAWLVRRGSLVKRGGSSEMPEMCRSLVDREEWCGEDFSAGDHEISRIAASQDSSGNAQQWLQWCMSHHFEFVVDQIRNRRVL